MIKQDHVQRLKDGRKYLRYMSAPAAKLPRDVAEDSEVFLAVYNPALEAAKKWVAAHDKGKRIVAQNVKKDRIQDAKEGVLDAVIHGYYQTDKYKSAPHNTQRNQRYNLTRLADFTVEGDRLGTIQATEIKRQDLRRLMIRMSAGSARPWLSAVKALFLHAVSMELKVWDEKAEAMRPYNEDDMPTLGLKAPPRGKRDPIEAGHRAWNEEHVAQFRVRWAEGTEVRTGMELIRFTGCAAVDAVKIGWKNVRPDEDVGNVVQYKRSKTKANSTNPLWADLEAYLVRNFGRDWKGPFIRGGDGEKTNGHNFSERFRRACLAAGIVPDEDDEDQRRFSAHGLRKWYVTELAENGATTTELQAAGGWTTEEEPAYYTRSADQKKAARGLFRKMGANVVPMLAAGTNANEVIQAAG